MATFSDGLTRKRCSRCGSQFLVSLPRKKGTDSEVGECPNILCFAIAHYSDEEWSGKADMAKARRAVDIALTPFDLEALKRFP